MRCAIAILSSFFLLQAPAFAQNRVDVEDLAHHPIEVDFPSGGQLELHIRSAEIHILGSEEDKVVVRAAGREGSDSTGIRAHFENFARSGRLRVNGGPDGNVSITVQIPKHSDLAVRIFAGEVEIKGIKGNKNVDLSAGNLTIGVGDPADYFHVDASVTTGNIEAAPFGESRGGMFRSFEKSGNGRYKLVAHVGAGNLTLSD
jgi:hypothetical protein